MAGATWKGYITFGLVTIPVKLFPAARPIRIHFHQLHRPCGTRIKQQNFCPTCQRVVPREEIVKGYEVEKEEYVIVEDKELQELAPPSAHAMEIQEFVKLSEVDPVYFESSYYVVPDEAGEKAYALLLKAMKKTGLAGIARWSTHHREYVTVIRRQDNGIMLHTLYFYDEVRKIAEYGQTSIEQVKPQELQLACQLLEALAAPFEPEKFRDTYRERVLELIEAKRAGMEVPAEQPRKLAPVIDLMEALQKSLAATPKKVPQPAAPAMTAQEAGSSEEVVRQSSRRRSRR